jgi:glycine betaine/proline transport system substrate-binding protein
MVRSFLIGLVMALWPATAAMAQESVITLGPPEGASSGETMPEEAAAPPPRCGTQPITIGRMQWPSAAILAQIHALILAAELECTVRVQTIDPAAAGSAMATTGQPAVVPELWLGRIAEIWNAGVKAQKVRQAALTYVEPVFEGWFVPDYVAEAMPETTTIEGLKQRWPDFAGEGARGRFLSCPPDWACAVINRNLLRAHGLDSYFEIVEPANRFEMDTLIAEAVGRREPLLFYYWQPNAVLAQFAFNPVELGSFEREAFTCLGRANCPAPAPSGFPPEPVVIALSEWVYLEATTVAAYFQRARMPVKEMNLLLQQLGEPGATAETVAERFVAERSEIWRPWLGAAASP